MGLFNLFKKEDVSLEGIELFDMHCHILPGIDDGSKSLEMSKEMLDMEANDHVRVIAFTPHYYSRESIPEFIKKRNEAFEKIKDLRNDIDYVLGAEVYYRHGIVNDEHIYDLCLGNSNYLLLEMPFERWNNSVIKELHAFSSKGIRVIIAHIERYIDFQTDEIMDEVYDMNPLIQSNCEFILENKKARKMFKNGIIDLLGSDAHNLDRRKPNMAAGAEELLKNGFEEQLNQINMNSIRIIKAALKNK